MKNLIEFNPNRFMNLLKLEATTKNKRALMVLAAVLGAMLLYQFLLIKNQDHDAYGWINESFGAMLMITGFIYTSYSFFELSESSTSMTYLTLPASNFEKFASKWLFSTLGFYLVFLIGYSIFAFIGINAVSAMTNFKTESYAPFAETNWLLTKLYFVLSSIFLLGAITFKNYHAPKTVLSLVAFNIFLGVMTYLIVRVVFFEYFEGWEPVRNVVNTEIRPNQNMEAFVTGPLKTIGKLLLWVGLPLFFWTVSFFKLKEKEL